MVYGWVGCWCHFVGLLRSGAGCYFWPGMHCCGSICYFRPFGKTWFGVGCCRSLVGEPCFRSSYCFLPMGFFLVLIWWVCSWVLFGSSCGLGCLVAFVTGLLCGSCSGAGWGFWGAYSGFDSGEILRFFRHCF